MNIASLTVASLRAKTLPSITFRFWVFETRRTYEQYAVETNRFTRNDFLLGFRSKNGTVAELYAVKPATRRKKGKDSPCSIAERRVLELIPVLGSQPAGEVSHKPGGRLPLLSARPAVTIATLKRAATSFAAWWTKAQWVWTACLRLLPDTRQTAIWTKALLRLSPAR